MKIKNQRGQAITETIVSMSVLVVFFLWASSLYVLNQSTIDATMGSRLSVWYQSLFGSASGLDAEQLRVRAGDLVGDVYVEKRVDFSRRMNAESCFRNGDCYVVGEVNDGVWDHGVDSVAGATISPTFIYPSSRSSTIANRLGLDTEDSPTTIRSEIVSIPVNPNFSLLERAELTGSFADYGDSTPGVRNDVNVSRFSEPDEGFKISRRAALLSNTGVLIPDNDEQFQTFIEDLSADGPSLAVFEPLRPALVGFQEVGLTLVPGGMSTVPAEQSAVLPLGVYQE